MTIIANIERYVAIKRGLGYKFFDQARMLRKYATFAEAAGDIYTSASHMIEWAGTAPSVQSSREWLRVARHFAISMHAEDDRNEIPPRDAFGWGKRPRPRPHILLVPDIERIVQAALSLPPVASITPYTYHYLIGLLAATGMRVSEAVALLESDLTRDGILIRETKFHKSRLVPIHPTTRKALSEYVVLRRRIGGPDPHLFVLSTGEPPDHASVTRAFIKLARQLGVRDPEGRGPRLHDLRHSFAIRSLEQCGDGRAEINRHMLALSTYLGHACITDTYWYLEATPVLTRQIADAAAVAFRKGGAS